MFVLPWGDHCLVGTTDTDYDGDLDRVAPSEADAQYLLDALRKYFPSADVAKEDIVSSYAAVRPLAAELGVTEDDVARDQLIFESSSGLVSIIGGKLTTHRSMAEALVNYIANKLTGELAAGPKHRCETKRLSLDYDQTEAAHAIDNLTRESNLDHDVATHLVETYGPDTSKILEITHAEPESSSRIVTAAPYVMAEIRFAARYQMAMKLVDFMFRRTQLAFRLKDHGRSVVRSIANEMADELGWSTETVEKELIDFERACMLIEVQRDG
jgi:glycerol-3-phosphate dehydrogenase